MLTDVNYIKSLLRNYNFKFSKSLGQNFVADSSVIEAVVRAAEPLDDCLVIEIGPGAGALTAGLASRAAKVIAVEIDPSLIPVLSENLIRRDAGPIKRDTESNIEIVQADILRADINSLLKDAGNLTPIICSNLPYNITTPVIELFLREKSFGRALFMLQKEAAERIAGKVGVVPLTVEYYTHAEILFDVPADKFFPVPQVNSSVIRLLRREVPAVNVRSEELFFKIIKAGFSARRKTLFNSLSQNLTINKNIIYNAIEQCGLDFNVRAERLSLQQFADISNVLFSGGI